MVNLLADGTRREILELLEHSVREPLEGGTDARRYGDTVITFFRREPARSAEPDSPAAR